MAKAKFDIKTEATKPFYAGVGVTDLAVGAVREYVADVQKKLAGVQKDVQKTVTGIELEPKALRDQAVTVVNARVDALTQDAKAFTGRFCIDDTLLYEHGVRDFETYRVDPSLELAPDFFVPDDIPAPPGVTVGTRMR